MMVHEMSARKPPRVERLDAIIPVRNEANTIGPILQEMYRCRYVNRVYIVIDPETMDGTENAVKRIGGRVSIIYSPAHGKGQCVRLGLRATETPRAILCDGDYQGLTRWHIEGLCQAYSGGQIIGVPDIPDSYPRERHWAWPWVSGFRSVPVEMLMNVDFHGYLLETQINGTLAEWGARPALFKRMHGLKSPYNMTGRRLAAMQADRDWGIKNGVFTDNGQGFASNGENGSPPAET